MADNEHAPNPNDSGLTYVSHQEPTAKPPPALETGLLKWVRENLFSSTFNSILTIIGLLVVVGSIVGTVVWVVQDANWFAITFNFRQFMIGRYEPQHEWRISLTALIVLFVVGMSIAIWVKQAARTLFISVLVIVLALLLLPPILISSLELPSYYSVAGTREIVSGSVTESAIPLVGFIGQEGEDIEIRLADTAVTSDENLAELSGFMDTAANTLRNAARTRLATIEREERLQETLAEDETSEIPQLTENQRDMLRSELENITIPEVVVEDFMLNAVPVQVVILDSETLEPIDDPVILSSPDDVLEVTLPADGWYLLEKTLVGADVDEATLESSLTILDIHGIYPILQSSSYSSDAGAFVDTFIRITDEFRLVEPLPRIEGEDVPFVVIIRNQYQGDHTFAQYLRTFVAPFFQKIGADTTLLLLLGVAGYAVAFVLERSLGRKRTSSITSYALLLLPVLIWILVNGLSALNAVMWLLLVGVIVYSLVLYHVGKVRGWDDWRYGGGMPLAPLMIAAGYGLALLVTLTTPQESFAGGLLSFSIVPFLLAALLGASISTPGQEMDRRYFFGMVGASVVIYLLGMFLLKSGVLDFNEPWFLEPTDPRNWGGLLLTMMLTIYGIIIAFPLGVGLALGRRSDLPAVKYVSIAYIELIRGSPFITVLFFMQLLIPLVSAELAEVPNSYRALVATIAFSAAYLAENVRGGLQSLPPGQGEAARALGLSAWQTTTLITLPQALRAVIPALVGQFISLFKDTSLVAIVGLIDLTGFVNSMVVQAEFIGTRLEGLLFISIIYFGFSYVMSYVSRLLEASGSGSTRRM